MKRRGQSEGFTLVELIISLAVMATVFAFSFKNLAAIRSNMKSQETLGQHLFFESFAVSKLKLYFAKFMQWNSHVCTTLEVDFPNCYCITADYFAYASNQTKLGYTRNPSQTVNKPIVSAISDEVANATLGADMRLALSTFTQQEVSPQGSQSPPVSLIDLVSQRAQTTGAQPWGALIPIDSVDEWKAANPYSRDWCVRVQKDAPTGTVKEMCERLESCTQAAGKTALKNQLGRMKGNVQDLSQKDTFNMCFIFAGNLFTRADQGGAENASLGLTAIDNPRAVGLVVAEARFVNNISSREIKCSEAATEMNRILKIRLDIYTAMNTDARYAKNQHASQSRRDISAEKIGVAIPNCAAPSRGGFNRVGSDATDSICIEDPTWVYECASACRPSPRN
jgi:prepilin-type N-terminal cleavage/methylation domain-containing protein